MEVINSLNCVVTFWKDGNKVFRINHNFFCDLLGMLHYELNENKFYDRATIEWDGKLITVDPSLEAPVFSTL